MVVALLLCTRAVTPMPAQKASGFFSTLRLRTVRKRAPNTRITPVRTMCVPQTSRATADSRCNSVSTEVGSPYCCRLSFGFFAGRYCVCPAYGLL
ncbi:hypothetical protein D3C85_1625750 [compost metagenome]